MVTTKSVNSKTCFIFKVLQITTFCCDDSFFYTLPTDVLERVFIYIEHISFTLQSNSSQTSSAGFMLLWRPGYRRDAMFQIKVNPLNEKVCSSIRLLLQNPTDSYACAIKNRSRSSNLHCRLNIYSPHLWMLEHTKAEYQRWIVRFMYDLMSIGTQETYTVYLG